MSKQHHDARAVSANVTIVGTGFIGRAWAISFARGGANVALWDQAQGAAEKAIHYIEGILDDLATNDLLNGQNTSQVLQRLTTPAVLGDALSSADYVQENTPEVLDTKIKVFSQLDAVAPSNAILASSTSALLPSAFIRDLAGRSRCLVVHPINPPYLIPAAEVVPAPWTSAETVSRTRDILVASGHTPLVMKKELDGFIMNRMQGALLEEAFRLVADGYASVEDVDIGIREGLALRWSFMGPFETIDLNAPGGIRDYVERYQSIYSNIFPQMQRRVDWAGPVMDKIESERRLRLAQDQLQDRQVWRDKRLMALAAHKRKSAKDFGV